jgi:hypothetical protein
MNHNVARWIENAQEAAETQTKGRPSMHDLENYLHPKVRAEIKDLDERRVLLTQLSPHFSRVERIAKDTIPEEIYHRVFFYSHKICLSFALSAYTDAIPILTALAKAGWKRVGKMDKQSTYFQWQLQFEARPGLLIDLEIDGTVSDKAEGNTCRRVQVGTKVSEYPVYEIVCDDPAEAIALAN